MRSARPGRSIDLLINDAHILTMDEKGRELWDSSIAVDAGEILEVGPTSLAAERYAPNSEIDASRMLALPGLVNAHNHLFQVMCRGLGDDADLSTWAGRAIWPVAVHLDADAVGVAANLACLEMIESGTTTVVDSNYLHADPGVQGSIAKACLGSGMRAILGRAAMDKGNVPPAFLETPEAALRSTADFIRQWNGRDGRILARPEPMNEVMASRQLILQLRALSRSMGTGFHMHIAETRDRPALLKQATGFRSVEYLDHLGVLGPDVVLAHCVWVNDEERESLARSDTSVAHNPISNQFLADGVAPVPDFLDRGIRVALGTDGAASNNALDMFEVMKSAALIQKVHALSCEAMSADQVLRAATQEGARALGIGDMVGSVEVGKRADIILLALDSPGMVPCYSAVSNVVYSATSRAVDTVIIDGKVVARGGKCLTLDREAVFEQARRLQRRLEAGAVSS